MKIRYRAYRLWWTITATSVVNLNLILFNIKSQVRIPLIVLVSNLKALMRPSKPQESQSSEPRPPTQLQTVRSQNLLRVSIIGDKAYWVKDNVFYEGEFSEGHVHHGSARPIDAFSIPDDEMHKLLKVLDNLG